MKRVVAALLFGMLLSSCGIEDYLFLYPVPLGNIRMQANTLATVYLPALNTAEYYYFRQFILYYRIYIGDVSLTNEINTAEDRRTINQDLYSDYAVIDPYTNPNNTTAATNIGSVFSGRKYYALQLEGVNIDDVLSGQALGKQIEIDFAQAPGTRPSLIIEGRTYRLYRSDGSRSFSPVPTDRYFLNHSDLNRSENAVSTINADVANKANITGPRYTYVAMYIVVVGSDPNYTPIYSRPTFVGIFRLPDPS